MKVLLLLLLAISCTKKEAPSLEGEASCQDPSQTTCASDISGLVSRGKSVFVSNCTACHNADPKKDGPLGPAVFGSSKMLLEARILHATYPEGYKPKRSSKVMVALPQLKGDLEALAAFLNQN